MLRKIMLRFQQTTRDSQRKTDRSREGGLCSRKSSSDGGSNQLRALRRPPNFFRLPCPKKVLTDEMVSSRRRTRERKRKRKGNFLEVFFE
jgi:hypothetical protein